MKNKLLLILFIMLLILTSCTTKDNEITAKVDNETEVIKDKNEEIKTDDENLNETTVVPEKAGESKEESKEELINKPNSAIIDEKNTELSKDDKKDNVKETKAGEETVQSDNKTVENENTEQKENVLKFQGLIENEISFTLKELKEMNDLIFEADFYSLNSFGTTGYTHFKGVNLWKLLELKSKILPEASKITIIAHDGYKMTFTLEQVKKQDYIDETNLDAKYPMIIAWEEKGVEYNSEEGAPFKLVVGQKEAGDVNKPNWVSNIDKIVIE